MAGKPEACKGCGAQLCDLANDAEPCWGQLEPTDMRDIEGTGYTDVMFEHTCEGHRGSEYVPES